MIDPELLLVLNSMQANLKADFKAAILSFKVDLIEHIHGVGAQLRPRMREIVEQMDRIVTKLDGNCDLLEGALRSSPRAIEWSEIGPKTRK
jgi:hypothetical protein